jgi:predicted dehydrogenase
MRRKMFILSMSLLILILMFCSQQKERKMNFTGAKGEVKILTIDPGHFHAALLQKSMYNQVAPQVHVYAPEGSDVDDHMNRIKGFNSREQDPTNWETKVYIGDDFHKNMVNERPGNLLITSGNNQKKTEYIKTAIDAGLNVLADKPMCIDKKGFELLKSAFESAEKNNVLLYDIMTERYEITTMLQKELANMPEVFGELQKGSPDNPSVTKESVHHFFKYVAGNPIKRPAWYFDVSQQGEGLVDVTTHLVDLVQWECFPGEILDYTTDIKMISASHWATKVTKKQFEKVTRHAEFPDYLKDSLDENGVLNVFCNGGMIYALKGVHAKVSVIWNFQAPEGTGDTHFSVMRGTKCDVVIKQGKEQNFKPVLYVEVVNPENKASVLVALKKAIEILQDKYPGVELKIEGDVWRVIAPAKYHVGHEAHFGQVTEKYLKFLIDGSLPDWEVPNMIAKYYTTTSAVEMAGEK